MIRKSELYDKINNLEKQLQDEKKTRASLGKSVAYMREQITDFEQLESDVALIKATQREQDSLNGIKIKGDALDTLNTLIKTVGIKLDVLTQRVVKLEKAD